jgi:cytochrome c oxidase cbb3-type subunit 1
MAAAARHSLGWLLAANLTGVLMAAVLLWPEAGDRLAPFTYGRWVPLHLNWQLYGWCSLPLVGVLLHWFFDWEKPRAAREARWALGAWSLALALGGVSWLAGVTSGKLFLDWHGWARPLLPLAMAALWLLLAKQAIGRWAGLSTNMKSAQGGALALLAAVPGALWWSFGREVYPAVNPDSGGATGAALLGSTLGIITLFLALPTLLGLAANRGTRAAWVALAVSWAVFAVLNHGDTSHHDRRQIAALAVVLAWIPLLARQWASFAWPGGARPWVRAALTWWALLAASGWLVFLPGMSEATKFTHGLVAHSHLAMAGLVTAVNAAALVTLTGRPAPRGVFTLWNAGCAAHVLALAVLGAMEADHAAELFRGEAWTQVLFAARLAAGLAMTFASARWLVGAWRA